MNLRSILQFKLQIALVFAMAVWGLSWTNAKILGVYTSPPLLMFWRFFLATLCFIPILKWTGHSFKIPQSAFKFVFLNGFLMTVYNYFYFRGTQLGLAGAGGVIVTTLNPIITSILALVILRDPMKFKDMAGAVLGFTGGLFIMKIWSSSATDIIQSGNIYFLLAAVTWAFVTLITSSAKETVHFIPYSFWSIAIAGILSFFLSFNEPLLIVFNFGWTFWFNLFVISAGAMVFGTTVYFLATVRLGTRKASAYIFTVPVTAMGFSMIILGESLDWNTALGSVLGISGVYMINRS